MNGFHLAIVAAGVLACPLAVSAQSIIESELTRTTLASSVDAAGHTLLTATVTTESGSGVPGGTVRFIDEASLSVLGWADVAHPSIVIDRLSEGLHRFRAAYSGTANYLPVMIQPSQSDIVAKTVRGVPDVSVSSSQNPCASGAVITLTAAVAGRGRMPTGAVTFRDGGQVLAVHVAVDRAGIAAFTTSALADGVRMITAEYEGDASHAPVTSSRLTLDVGEIRVRSSQLQNAD